jgi:hypothetical protein
MGNFRNGPRILRATATEEGRAHLLAAAVFERIDLSRLEVDQAVGYGIRDARMRLGDDHEKIERVEVLRRLLPAMFWQRSCQGNPVIGVVALVVSGDGNCAGGWT